MGPNGLCHKNKAEAVSNVPSGQAKRFCTYLLIIRVTTVGCCSLLCISPLLPSSNRGTADILGNDAVRLILGPAACHTEGLGRHRMGRIKWFFYPLAQKGSV